MRSAKSRCESQATHTARPCFREACWPVTVAYLALALHSVPAYAYEADVHYGLTKWLAQMAGFSPKDSQIIANANNGLDEWELSAVPMVFLSGCIRGNRDAANRVREDHFATVVPVPNSPNARWITPGNSYAATRARDMIRAPYPNQEANLLEFGARLHAVQDTWSHKHEPDVPRAGSASSASPTTLGGIPAIGEDGGATMLTSPGDDRWMQKKWPR